jgi:hypothetical protein
MAVERHKKPNLPNELPLPNAAINFVKQVSHLTDAYFLREEHKQFIPSFLLLQVKISRFSQ